MYYIISLLSLSLTLLLVVAVAPAVIVLALLLLYDYNINDRAFLTPLIYEEPLYWLPLFSKFHPTPPSALFFFALFVWLIV